MENIPFGEYIKNIRIEKGLSLREASALLGISHSYLNKLERGMDIRNNNPARPNPEMLDTIASKYELDYNYLMKLCGYLKNHSTKDETTNENTILKHIEIEETAEKEKDISKLLEKSLSEIGELEGLMFHGEPINYNDFIKIRDAINFGIKTVLKDKKK